MRHHQFITWEKMKSLTHVRLFAAPWTVAYQASPSMGFSRQEYWSGVPLPSPGESSQPRDRTQVSHIGGRCFNLWATREDIISSSGCCKLCVRTIWNTRLHMLYHWVTLIIARRPPSHVFEPLSHDEGLGDLRDWSLVTPLIVSRSRIQVCGVIEGSCAKTSTQACSDQWDTHTYSQQQKCHLLALFPWRVYIPIFPCVLETKHIQAGGLKSWKKWL